MTGTSVLAVKYDEGVMMTCDTLGSYGSLARFKNVERIQPFGQKTLIAAGGEISDFQEIKMMLKNIEIEDYCADDGCPYVQLIRSAAMMTACFVQDAPL